MGNEVLIAEKKLINMGGSMAVILPEVVLRFWGDAQVVNIYTTPDHEIIIRPKK
ncbi:MAG: hypothetical protein ACPLVI_04565 [Thermoplasmata archaeon]|jgi:antitoxin component of MazEF toxin-antitoxin module